MLSTNRHINTEQECVFIHVPKTGGTSMERALGIPRTVHLRAGEQRTVHPEFFLWGFVRHPCDRILSAYCYECKAERRIQSPSDLVEYVFQPPVKTHTRPQVWFTHRDDQLQLDFVGRFESLDADFERLCLQRGWSSRTLERANASAHPPWYDIFTDRMIAATKRNFAADFEHFGYDPFVPYLGYSGSGQSGETQLSIGKDTE